MSLLSLFFFFFARRPNPTGAKILSSRVSRVLYGLTSRVRVRVRVRVRSTFGRPRKRGRRSRGRPNVDLTLTLTLGVNPHRTLETLDDGWHINVRR